MSHTTRGAGLLWFTFVDNAGVEFDSDRIADDLAQEAGRVLAVIC